MAELKTAHLVLMGFSEEMIARNVLYLIKEADKAKAISVLDWALATKDRDGKVKIEGDKGVDPGAKRGGVFGGAIGVLLVAAGPVGMGAVAVGAGVGAVAAKLRDSGMQNKDLDAVTDLMREGRSGLVIALDPASVDAWTDFVAHTVEFHAAQPVIHADISPDHTFEQVIAEYREAHQV
jgi:uncharacterized membrane protein